MKKLLFILFILPIFSKAQIIYTQSYENANASGGITGFSWKDTCCTWSLNRSSDYARVGSYSGKVILNKTDPLVSNNHRSEGLWNSIAYAQQTTTGVRWISYSTLLPATGPDAWVNDPTHPEAILNIHDGEPCANVGTNPAAIWILGDHYYYILRYDSLDYCTNFPTGLKSSPSGGYSVGTIPGGAPGFDLGPVTTGVWEDWVVHCNWRAEDSGYVQIWRNGVKKVDYVGKCWFKGCFTEPYVKVGIYKFSWTNETSWGGNSTTTRRVLYDDNFKTGGPSSVVGDFAVSGTPPTAVITGTPSPSSGSVTIQLPTSSVTLEGNTSTDDGSITGYAWTKVSGPSGGTITTASAHSTTVTSLQSGTYVYQLVVTDNTSLTGSAQVTIVVQPASIAPNTTRKSVITILN